MPLQVSQIKDLDQKIDNLRNKGKTDTAILDYLSSQDTNFGQRVQSSRSKFATDQSIKNDRDLLNFISQKVAGKMPTVASIPLEGESTTKQVKEEEKPGFIERTVEGLKERGQGLKETWQKTAAGEINPLQTGIRTVGEAIGAASDVLGEGIMSGVGAITPEPVKQFAKEIAQNIMQTEIGQMGLEAAKKGIQAYADWKVDHPEAAKDLESVANIASILPIEKAIGIGAKSAKGVVEAGETALKAGKKVVVETAEEFAEAGIKTATKSKKMFGKLTETVETALKNVEINKKAKAELAEQITKAAPAARNAIKSGLEIRDANLVSNMSKAVLKQGDEALEIAKQKALGSVTKQEPREIVGKAVLDQFKAVDQARKSVGKTLGEYAAMIPNTKTKGRRFTLLNKLKQVDGMEGLKAKLTRADKYVLDFTDTTLSTQPSVQKKITALWNDASSRTNANMHRLRQELFEEMGRKSATLIKPVEGTEEKVIEALRQGMADVLDSASKRYKELNKQYAFYENALKDTRKVLKPVQGAEDDILESRLAQIARRLTSNNDAVAKGGLRKLEQAAIKAGFKSGIDIENLQELINIIVKIFGVAEDTGLAGQIKEGVMGSIPTSKRDLLSKAISGVLENTADIRTTSAVQQEALGTLIKELLK